MTETRTRMHKRAVEREPIREDVREPIRAGRVQAKGRDGKLLSRKRGNAQDRFYVPPEIIPEGWSYEWKAYTVVGQPQDAHQIHMAENGWTPVPAKRHEGLFMPPGHDGSILRDGLILMERPIELTMEARDEDRALSLAQTQAQKEQLGLALPSGFDQRHRGVQPQVRRSYEPADVERPRLQVEP